MEITLGAIERVLSNNHFETERRFKDESLIIKTSIGTRIGCYDVASNSLEVSNITWPYFLPEIELFEEKVGVLLGNVVAIEVKNHENCWWKKNRNQGENK